MTPSDFFKLAKKHDAEMTSTRMTKAELEGTHKTPGSRKEALRALEDDHAFLTRGDVFIDVICTWIDSARERC